MPNKLLRLLLLISSLLIVPTGFAAESTDNIGKATFAGGCFWCTESDFEKVPGVIDAVSGYIGGHKDHPTYKEVSAGKTGHIEAVEITYDKSRISYTELLDIFWHNVDPTVKDQQFCDKGTPYQSHIFTHNAEQKRLAEASKAALIKSKPFPGEILTPITDAGTFWPAEKYHQDYYKRNAFRYKFYRYACGRDKRLTELWGEKKGGH